MYYGKYKAIMFVFYILVISGIMLYSLRFDENSTQITGAAITESPTVAFVPLPLWVWIVLFSLIMVSIIMGIYVKKYDEEKERPYKEMDLFELK